MARSGIYRDTQKSRVYTWETSGFLKPFWDRSLSMKPDDVIALCHQILRDAARGGSISTFKIEFDKRAGGACGSVRGVAFTPWNMPKILVLHEMAHALTYPHRDTPGHGPNYVSCYLRLLNKYLNLNLDDLILSLQKPVEKRINVITRVAEPSAGFSAYRTMQQTKIKHVKPPTFSRAELSYWQSVIK